jgi:hypothetical protein
LPQPTTSSPHVGAPSGASTCAAWFVMFFLSPEG